MCFIASQRWTWVDPIRSAAAWQPRRLIGSAALAGLMSLADQCRGSGSKWQPRKVRSVSMHPIYRGSEQARLIVALLNINLTYTIDKLK